MCGEVPSHKSRWRLWGFPATSPLPLLCGLAEGPAKMRRRKDEKENCSRPTKLKQYARRGSLDDFLILKDSISQSQGFTVSLEGPEIPENTRDARKRHDGTRSFPRQKTSCGERSE